MTETAPAPKKRTGRRFTLVLFALLVVIVVAGIAMWSRAQSKHLRDEFAAHGYPTSLQELDKWYTAVPQRQNAGLKFIGARDAMVTSADAARLPYVGDGPIGIETLTPELLPTADAFLAANKPALELAHAAAVLRIARYPVDFSQLPLPATRWDEGQKVARMLWLEAALRARQGKAEEATAALEAAFTYTSTVANDPFMMSHVQTLSLLARTISTSCDVMSVATLDKKQLDRLQEVLRYVNIRQSFERALVSDAVFCLYSDYPGNIFGRPLALWDRAAYGQMILALVQASILPTPEFVLELRRLNAKHPPLANITQPGTEITRGAYLSTESTSKGIVRSELFTLVLVIERSRLVKNAVPSKLEELVPRPLKTLPKDPFGDGAYKYESKGNGYILYSVGPDGVDGHGDTEAKDNDDLVVRVTR